MSKPGARLGEVIHREIDVAETVLDERNLIGNGLGRLDRLECCLRILGGKLNAGESDAGDGVVLWMTRLFDHPGESAAGNVKIAFLGFGCG